MAHKRIENDVIHTTNGVDTITYPVYVRELRTYTPLPNGFNRDLALAILGFIKENQALWDQNTWRLIFDLSETEMPGYYQNHWQTRLEERDLEVEDVQAALQQLAHNVDATENPTCGTAMCLAGWVGEFTGADWVIDRKLLLKSKTEITATNRAMLGENVVVPGKSTRVVGFDGQREDVDYWWTPSTGRIEEVGLIEHLTQRGFNPTTHHLVHVKDYAAQQLGLTQNEGTLGILALFDGNNTIEDLEAIIEFHTEFGPEAEVDFDKLPSYQPGGKNYDADEDGE